MTAENHNSVGELLRQGRLRQRLSIAECAKRTRIAIRFIEALEEERWADLPSESHQLGFLKLYSRFLGVPVDEAIALFQKKGPVPPTATSQSPVTKAEPPVEKKPAPSKGHWSPNSIPQVLGIAIAILLLSWLVYHAVFPRLIEQNPMPWTHRHAQQQARLVVPKSSITNHKVNVKAVADSWLRVTSHSQLLFEGILPAGAAKEWHGAGPFQLKIGNVRALTVFWNDQPVDISSNARGTINEIRIPPQ